MKEKKEPRSCPSGCGFLIVARDTNPLCITCFGVQHAQASLDSLDNCTHCRRLPTKALQRWLNVTASSGSDLTLEEAAMPEASQPQQVGGMWGDMVKGTNPLSQSSALQELFPKACDHFMGMMCTKWMKRACTTLWRWKRGWHST